MKTLIPMLATHRHIDNIVSRFLPQPPPPPKKKKLYIFDINTSFWFLLWTIEEFFAEIERDYTPQRDDELKVTQGDTVELLQPAKDRRWWLCKLGDKKGLCPSVSVSIIGAEVWIDSPFESSKSKSLFFSSSLLVRITGVATKDYLLLVGEWENASSTAPH